MSEGKHAAAVSVWPLMLTAAAILMITMGARQSVGLFVSPLNSSTGLGIVAISFALAVGQFVWGVSQPIFGAIADKYGPSRVIIAGAILLAAGSALTPFVSSGWMLLLTLGVLAPAGAGAGSFSILIGATAGRLPADKRAFAAGFINAGGSFGQFLFAPLNQALISAFGWVSAMIAMAVAALATDAIGGPAGKAAAGIAGARHRIARGTRTRAHAARINSAAPLATRAIGCCTQVSSPVAFTLLSWSRTFRGRCSSVECPRAWRPPRSRSSDLPTSQAA